MPIHHKQIFQPLQCVTLGGMRSKILKFSVTVTVVALLFGAILSVNIHEDYTDHKSIYTTRPHLPGSIFIAERDNIPVLFLNMMLLIYLTVETNISNFNKPELDLKCIGTEFIPCHEQRFLISSVLGCHFKVTKFDSLVLCVTYLKTVIEFELFSRRNNSFWIAPTSTTNRHKRS